MCGYFCIEFIDFMLEGKSFLDYTNLFSPIYFLLFSITKNFLKRKKIIVLCAKSLENLKVLKCPTVIIKH